MALPNAAGSGGLRCRSEYAYPGHRPRCPRNYHRHFIRPGRPIQPGNPLQGHFHPHGFTHRLRKQNRGNHSRGVFRSEFQPQAGPQAVTGIPRQTGQPLHQVHPPQTGPEPRNQRPGQRPGLEFASLYQNRIRCPEHGRPVPAQGTEPQPRLHPSVF